MGQLLWTPALLLLYRHRAEIFYPSTLFLFILFSFLAYTIIFITPIYSLPIIITITMPLTIYITMIRNVLTGSIMIVIMSVFSLYAAYKNIGIFSQYDIVENIINLNFFILSHILIVLTIGTLYHENIRTKKKLTELNDSLEEKVVKQVEELNKQNILIAQQARLASMGEMLAMIAHQWRQPLNRINSNIAVISTISGSGTMDHTMFQDKTDNIKKQTKFMSDTIEDFTDFFHPDKKKVKFMPLKTVERAFKLLDTQLQHISIDIKAGKEVWLYSFENEYLQVLLTILHNAIENFNTRSVQDPKIQIILQTSGEMVSLCILDNGGGSKAKRSIPYLNPILQQTVQVRTADLDSIWQKYLLKTVCMDS